MILDELLAYVRFDDHDRARLRALEPRLAPAFPAIAAAFYDALQANAGAAAMLSGPEQVERLRVTLIDWMSSGLVGPYDQAFHDKRARIGRRHVQIGLPQHYMFTAMNVVRAAYTDHIAALYEPVEAIATIRSVDKLFDIELALMLRRYQIDSEDRRVRAMQTMAAGLAHEVRNPLNAAKLQLELLERRVRRGSADPKLTSPAELASQEIVRLTALLDDFLAFARAPGLHVAQHDVVAMARHVVELEQPLAEREGKQLALAGDLDAPIVAAIDVGKVHQVLLNLVRNAREAARSTVSIGVDTDPHALYLRVTDDGHGIPDEVRARIFEPFFSTKPQGTGMGMSIVHTFVALHGGRVDIATGPAGTTVTVALPR